MHTFKILTRVYQGLVASLQLVTPKVGFAVVHRSIDPNVGLNDLVKSVDAGSHWTKIEF